MELQSIMSKAKKQTSISSCFGSEEQDLLQALILRDTTRFSDILTEADIDLDKEFEEEPCCGATLLEKSCELGLVDFASILFSQGTVDVNRWSSRKNGRPIHIVASRKNPAFLKLLLENGADVNSGNWLGQTALHIASKNNDLQTLSVLFNHPKSRHVLNKNPVDQDGRPPVFIAAAEKAREAVLFLTENGADLKLESESDGMDTMELLEEEMPDILEQVQEILERSGASTESSGNPDSDLWKTLQDNDLEKFKKALEAGADVNKIHTDRACLHYATENGMKKFVELLLKHEAKVNLKDEADHWTAAHYAAAHGYLDILELLSKYDADLNAQTKSRLTPLHFVTNKDSLYQNERSEYDKCLDFLLRTNKVNVNLSDQLDNNCLHFAVSHQDEKIILKLLRHHADFTKENEWGERPLDLISADIMNQFLSEYIEPHGKNSKDFTLTFNYECLMAKEESANAEEERASYAKIEQSRPVPRSETKVLRHLAKMKKHLPLLKHPLIKSFLYLKWQKCSRYYFVNTLMYVVFVALLTFYCLQTLASSSGASANVTSSISETDSKVLESISCQVPLPWYVTLVGVILLIFNTILAVRETFQFLVAPVRYVWMLENLAEWTMIVCLYALLVISATQCDVKQNWVAHSLAAVALFLAWVELVLLFGRYRRFSVSVSIFLEVSWNFIKLIAWYLVFVCGFVFTFFLLFEPQGEFVNVIKTFMKIMVMMTGEFDYSSELFEKNPIVGGLMFLLFLFFVTIVLMNLLTGLAVEDTRIIRNNAEIIYQKSQLDLISYIEAMFFGDYEFLREYPALSWVPHCFPMKPVLRKSSKSECFQFLGRHTLLFYSTFPDMKVSVKPGTRNCTVETNDGSNLTMNKDIIKDTKDLLEGSDEDSRIINRVNDVERKVEEVNQKLDALDKNIRSIITKMTTLSDTVNPRGHSIQVKSV